MSHQVNQMHSVAFMARHLGAFDIHKYRSTTQTTSKKQMSMSDRNKNYVPIMELLPYHKKIRGCFCYFFLAILSKIQSDKRQILRQYGFEIKTHRDYWNVNLLFELQSIVASAPCSTYKHCIYSSTMTV